MNSFKTPRILIAGTGSEVGKSLVTLGLVVELRQRKQSVCVVVTGPAIAQASIFYRLTRRYCRVIDANLLSSAQIRFALDQASMGADVLIIDGHQGLFDGRFASSALQSDAGLAAWTKTPVVLVVDGSNIEASISPIVRGFWVAAQNFDFAGALVNKAKVGDGRGRTEAEVFEKALLNDELNCFLGSMPFLSTSVELPGRLPSQQKNVTSLPRSFYLEVAEAVKKYVRIDQLLAAAADAGPLPSGPSIERIGRRCKIAIADDSCFNFTVQDNLELLRFYGAELVSFSPLVDSDLPNKIGALYFPGAFIHDYAGDLSANHSMKKAIKEFASRGGIIYSEGSASAYLCENFSIPNKGVFDGVGVIPGFAEAHPPKMQYVQASLQEDSVLSSRETFFKAIQTGEWSLVPNPGLKTSMRVKNEDGTLHEEGYMPMPRIFSTFLLPHFGSNPAILKQLVDEVSLVK